MSSDWLRPAENQLTCHCPGPLVYSYGIAPGCPRSSARTFEFAAAIRSTWAASSRNPFGGVVCEVTEHRSTRTPR